MTLKIIKQKIKNLLYFFNINRNKDVLVYLGLNKEDSFDRILRQYKYFYGFEANPELCKKIKVRFGKYKNVHILSLAVAKNNGNIAFNISSNDGLRSSIGTFKETWNIDSNIILAW